MSQILSQIPRQLLQQQQRLTPQLIQAMDILQLNALALESRIAQELDGNPALELVPGEDEVSPATDGDSFEDRQDGERALVVHEGDAGEFERLDSLVREYDWLDDDFQGTVSRARGLEESDGKLDAMANTAARPIGLNEHLLQQWGLMEIDERMRALGEAIVNHIDEAGRLATPLAEIAGGAELDPPASEEELVAALAVIQQLDPPGVGARTVKECLLLQLKALPGDNELERRIIAEHFENLQKNRLPAIAKALEVDVEEVKAAIHVIGRLSLHPGRDVVATQTPALVPDLIVEFNEREDRYEVRLARGNMRDLRISPEFRRLMERSRDDAKAREFVKQKVDAAGAIIDAIRFRRDRLLEIGKAVVEAQRDFLDRGEQHLKVLRMSDLAVRFGCDPSTVSRTVDEKYMQTPRGIYPLRMFFTGGAETQGGEALGWASIKAKVQEIIDHEDKGNPLSDDEIVRRLQSNGVEIKRRTVAKYRSQLGIPPARQRRQY
jgi:RNA polymerase sigma-54 factor